MLGDTGVAVSPSDERYANLVGKTVMLPLVNREIPVFSDFYVDKDFGTGCVKVTPAHDPNDFAMGERHDLPKINIFDETAHVVEGYGKFSGMTRDEARVAVVEAFDELGLLDHVEDHDHAVMHCYRCHTTLEPWLSEQWFVAVDRLKEPAARVVRDKEITFHPTRWPQPYLAWMQNLKDWCISRQLWWGHRFPVFYCDECGWEDASVDGIDVCPSCGAPTRQDEDVLDTWFSSQLWPFCTQGWASQGTSSPDIVNYYPTQVLSTARDIMGLWVARMVMSSMYCTGQIPFEKVIIHPTVMGTDGKPMSKSRGNGIDPVQLMNDYGADAMRFGLLMQVTGAQAMRFDYQKMESSRNFVNKIRNAARFVLMHLDGYEPGEPSLATDADKWMSSRLASVVAQVDAAYDSFEFGELTRLLYAFVWNEFCDWYIEFSKSRLAADADPQDRLTCQRNLVYVLDVIIRLLHPIMPFVTESLYAELPIERTEPQLIVAHWPCAEELAQFRNVEAERPIELACAIIGAVRSPRARYNLSPKTALAVTVKPQEEANIDAISSQTSLICALANVEELQVSADATKPKDSSVILVSGMEVYINLSGLVDFAAEKARLEKELAKDAQEVARLEKKLSNPGFLAKAAPDIIAKDTAKLNDSKARVERITAQLAEMA